MTQELIANMSAYAAKASLRRPETCRRRADQYSRGTLPSWIAPARGSHVRMLRGRQERIGSFAARPHGILKAAP